MVWHASDKGPACPPVAVPIVGGHLVECLMEFQCDKIQLNFSINWPAVPIHSSNEVCFPQSASSKPLPCAVQMLAIKELAYKTINQALSDSGDFL